MLLGVVFTGGCGPVPCPYETIFCAPRSLQSGINSERRPAIGAPLTVTSGRAIRRAPALPGRWRPPGRGTAGRARLSRLVARGYPADVPDVTVRDYSSTADRRPGEDPDGCRMLIDGCLR